MSSVSGGDSRHEVRIFGWSLTPLILGALVLGIVFGLLVNRFSPGPEADAWLVDGALKAGGDLFFRALRLLVVPVVFVSLICGVGAMDDVRRMGRIGVKTLGFYLVTTALAVSLALGIAILTRPGAGFELTSAAEFGAKDAPGFVETLTGFIPTNPIRALADADSNMIAVIVLALLFGVSISLAGAPGRRVLAFFQDLNEVVMRLVTLVMMTAPAGVFCLIAIVFARQGFAAIEPLLKYFMTVAGVLLVHLTFVYGGFLSLVGGLNPFVFLRKFKDVLIFAFSTSSSNATLPLTIENVERRLGVGNSVAAFTLPLGATINMDGTAIMQGVATVFISQAYGIDIGLGGYLAVIGTATLASVGTAGVPGVGLVTLAMVLRQVDLPVEGIGLIIGVDRLLDMARTAVNVSGDAVVTCVVAKSENQLDLDVYRE